MLPTKIEGQGPMKWGKLYTVYFGYLLLPFLSEHQSNWSSSFEWALVFQTMPSIGTWGCMLCPTLQDLTATATPASSSHANNAPLFASYSQLLKCAISLWPLNTVTGCSHSLEQLTSCIRLEVKTGAATAVNNITSVAGGAQGLLSLCTFTSKAGIWSQAG